MAKQTTDFHICSRCSRMLNSSRPTLLKASCVCVCVCDVRNQLESTASNMLCDEPLSMATKTYRLHTQQTTQYTFIVMMWRTDI